MTMRSLLRQEAQIAASNTYDAGIINAHTVGVAEGQVGLEGDLNVLRSLVSDIVGKTNWFDAPEMGLEAVAKKMFLEKLHPTGFDNVATGIGSSSTAFDAAIKTIVAHNDGLGSSTVEGVVVNAVTAYRIDVRDHATQNAVDDSNGNEVYGRLSIGAGTYSIAWFSHINGVETSYTFAVSKNVDLSFVAVSRTYKNLDWSVFLSAGFHDTSGLVGTIVDDNIAVNGMSMLLNGQVTQAQVNLKLDKLGSTASGEGASGIGLADSANWYTTDNAESAFSQIASLFGSTTGSTHAFTEQNVVANNDPVYNALDKLDMAFGDLSSVAANEGASLIGVEDAANSFTAVNVEGVLAELYSLILDNAGWEKKTEEITVPLGSGTSHTIPGGLAFTPAAEGANMDVYVNGQLQYAGTGNDYTEVNGTTIQFTYTIRPNSVITYQIRK
jgi:hypothetical protein